MLDYKEVLIDFVAHINSPLFNVGSNIFYIEEVCKPIMKVSLCMIVPLDKNVTLISCEGEDCYKRLVVNLLSFSISEVIRFQKTLEEG